eukprot:SAG31_NODE_1140_length_9701_cov_43.848261_9_plen_172_part_00
MKIRQMYKATMAKNDSATIAARRLARGWTQTRRNRHRRCLLGERGSCPRLCMGNIACAATVSTNYERQVLRSSEWPRNYYDGFGWSRQRISCGEQVLISTRAPASALPELPVRAGSNVRRPRGTTARGCGPATLLLAPPSGGIMPCLPYSGIPGNSTNTSIPENSDNGFKK